MRVLLVGLIIFGAVGCDEAPPTTVRTYSPSAAVQAELKDPERVAMRASGIAACVPVIRSGSDYSETVAIGICSCGMDFKMAGKTNEELLKGIVNEGNGDCEEKLGLE